MPEDEDFMDAVAYTMPRGNGSASDGDSGDEMEGGQSYNPNNR